MAILLGGVNGKNDHVFVFRPNETILGEGKGDLSKATLNGSRPTLGKDIGTMNESFDNDTIYYSDGSNSGIAIKVTSETLDSVTFNITFPEIQGSGTESNPYLIYNVDSFLYLMQLDSTNKYYKIMNDLDFINISNYPKINFKGHLDGNNKTLKNITTAGTGVFSYIGYYNANSTIENLNVENINISPGNGDYLGGFASCIENTTLRNIHLNSGSVKNISNSVNSLSSTGGFAGNVSNTTIIENCSSSLNVTSEKNVGGFIGINMNSIIKNSYSNGIVNGQSNIGGFIGLQCISDSSYNVPQNVYYDCTNNELFTSVGGYAVGLHNSVALSISSLGIGIIGISVPKQITINTSEEIPYSITTTPNTSLPFSISVSDYTVLKYDNYKIKGLSNGISKVYTNLNVGSQVMRFESNVIVNIGNYTSPDIPNTQVPSKPFPFIDVKKDTWYYNSVKYVYDRNIILGSTATTFKPNNNLTRGMLVTILWRMEGSPNLISGRDFPDVKNDQYYFMAVKWAVSNKVVSGHGNGTFKPNDYITREQLSVMLYNYAKYKNRTGKSPVSISHFKDYKKVSSYSKESVQWAIANKVISGKENGTKIAPQGNATRAEASAMIQNYLSYVK